MPYSGTPAAFANFAVLRFDRDTLCGAVNNSPARQGELVPLTDTLRRALARATEPQVLFPLAAVFLLTVIWATTLGIIRVKSFDSRQAAAVSSHELLDTYEAQIVRALREIDQSLNLIRYWHERAGGTRVLAELKSKGLLPPDLLFTVSIAARDGSIVDTTRAPAGKQNIADQEYFRQQRDSDTLFIGHLARGLTGDGKLQFSRRLEADGAFDGVVIIAVDAAYFVSGYEPSKLGERGVLGLLGTDGVFRVRRTGESTFSGDVVQYTSVVSAPGADDTGLAVSTNVWDGERRWTVARELYGFPLAVVVGLSAQEQAAGARRDMRGYLWRAFFASVLAVLLAAVLGRMSWQLGQSRLRENETKLAHAQRVEYLAYHDGLTELPNRSLFSKLLSQSISEAHRYHRQLAVAFLDLDRFKQINDTLGHEAGDQLLREVALRLKQCVRESDTVARLGGDEFVVLLPELEDGKYAATVAQKILSVIATPFTLIGHEFRVTASIGISTYPQDGLDEQTLTKNADIAMYQAKEEGKNNFQFYSEKLNANSLERLTLESSLRHALERNEFRLYYQAKRDIGSSRITGMEALLRWQHPDLGTVAPMQFIPVAEETGLIVPIGKWVLRTACLQNVAWQKQGLPPLSIAVNLTARQFSDERLLQDVTSILQATGMAPKLLELEITESLLIHDVEDTLRILTGLKALGVRIAIDDFGTGYSSLATLQRFPLDTIKIDRSFVRGITGPAKDTGLADAIIAMGKSLSLTVVAQGVETREQAEFLRTHACDELQGFYFKRPLPSDEFTQLLLAQSTETTYTCKHLELKTV
jgi:diguanylate cyclase (GGDEF)-like protein